MPYPQPTTQSGQPGIPKILWLRNPTTRLWSHFHFRNRSQQRGKRRALSFREFLLDPAGQMCINAPTTMADQTPKVPKWLTMSFPSDSVLFQPVSAYLAPTLLSERGSKHCFCRSKGR